MPEEIWRPVAGYDGFYEVSDGGSVRSLRRETRFGVKGGRCIAQCTNRYGYLVCRLSVNGIAKAITVHRLVATAFLPNSAGLPTVNHRDGIKTNNVVNNLEWATCSEQHIHRCHVLKKIPRPPRGLANRLSVAVRGVRLIDGSMITFASMREARSAGFKNGAISLCVAGKQASHHGYRWEIVV